MFNFFKEKDKQKHILAHFVGVQGLILLGTIPWEAFVAMFVYGVVYEFAFRNAEIKESFRDVLANTIGGSTAFIWYLF